MNAANQQQQSTAASTYVRQTVDDDASQEEDDDFGPALPSGKLPTYARQALATRAAGAAIPSLSDLRAIHEEADEATHTTRQRELDNLRNERRSDRKAQQSRLDELLPKADAGTREKLLEKKRDLAASNTSFANAAHEAGDVELRDSDIMGEDGVSEFKRMKQNEERKKNDRELRREEVLRARKAEREEKLRVLKEKEEKTMEFLKEIAKQRFG